MKNLAIFALFFLNFAETLTPNDIQAKKCVAFWRDAVDKESYSAIHRDFTLHVEPKNGGKKKIYDRRDFLHIVINHKDAFKQLFNPDVIYGVGLIREINLIMMNSPKISMFGSLEPEKCLLKNVVLHGFEGDLEKEN